MVAGFKEFVMRGNVIDLAVAVVMGTAVTALVTSFTNAVIEPLLAAVGGSDSLGFGFTIVSGNPATFVNIGAVISALINFLIIAIIVFLMVKALNEAKNAAGKLTKKDEGEAEPEMNPPACPFCLEEVKEGATRCPHCAGAFDEPAAPTPVEE